jgi:hypothetical protein
MREGPSKRPNGPGDPTAAGFPQFRHGSIRLTALFNDPTVIE